MKKYTLALVFAATIALSSCGSGETSAPATTDSTKVDSATVIVDTTAVKADSTKTATDSVKTK